MQTPHSESLLWSVMQVPNDEFRFWNEAAKRQRGRYRDAGETYSKIFAEIAPRFSKLAARELSISEVSELVEDVSLKDNLVHLVSRAQTRRCTKLNGLQSIDVRNTP